MNTDQPMHPSGHTVRDAEAFAVAGVDPAGRQPREWLAVSCGVCGAATRHLSGTCDRHYQPPAASILEESLKDFANVSISIA